MPIPARSSYGASVDEVRLIHKLVKRIARPAGFQTFDVEFGEDSTGDPAVWIWFAISDDFPTTKNAIDRLNDLARAVKKEIFASGVTRVPYIRFRSKRQAGSERA